MSESQPAPGRRGARLRPALIVAAYAVCVVVFTWPLAAQLGDHFVLARGVDLWQHVWNFGWVRTALLDLHQSPYFTYSIYYPTGVPLVFHALNVFSATVSIPLQLLFGLVPAFNLLMIGNLLAAALAAYWLARVLGLDVAPAFLAGLLYACSPPLSSSFNNGQGELVSVFWIPLCLGLLLRGAGFRALGLPPGSRWYLVGVGAALVGSALAIYYWTASLAFFIAVYAVLEYWAGMRAGGWPAVRAWLGRLLLAGGTALVLASPLLVLLVRAQLRGTGDLGLSQSGGSDAVIALSSQDLLSFFLPLPSRFDPAQIGWQGANLGLGWTALALTGAALLLARGARRRGLVLWGVAAVLFGVLALGPALLVAGQKTPIPLPYAAILQIPGAAAMRVPLRFLTPLALCLGILAATGFAALGQRLPRTAGRARLLALVLALVAVEFFNVPRPLVQSAVQPFFHELAAQPSPCLGRLPESLAGCGAVLELPQETWLAPAMFHEAIDHHPMIGGYTSRHFPDPFPVQAPGVAQLIAADPAPLGPDILTPPLSATAIQAMDYYGVRYVVVHPLDTYPAAANLRRVLGTLFPGGSRASGDLAVYTVPSVDQDRAFFYLGDNWYDLEQSPDGSRHRWTDQQASLRLVVPPPAAGAYTLTATVYSVAGPRTLIARLDGQEIARTPVGLPPGGPVALPLTLTPGAHLLTLASLEPAQQPPGDRRTLSLGYSALVLAR